MTKTASQRHSGRRIFPSAREALCREERGGGKPRLPAKSCDVEMWGVCWERGNSTMLIRGEASDFELTTKLEPVRCSPCTVWRRKKVALCGGDEA